MSEDLYFYSTDHDGRIPSNWISNIVTAPEKEDDDVLTWAGKINNDLEGNNSNNNEISIPTATNNWSIK